MSIGEVFGVKQLKFKTKEKMKIEELFDKIEHLKFEAGPPQLVKAGLTTIIAFPQIDRNNQVQVLGNNGKFYVTRSATPAGKLLNNLVMEELTNGWSGMSAAFGKSKKLCMQLTEKTYNTIMSLGL